MTKTLPTTRAELLALHAEARRRRAAAALASPEYRAACEQIAAIEVRIAEVERPGSPAAGSPAKG